MVLIRKNKTKKHYGGFDGVDATLSVVNIDNDLKLIIKTFIAQLPLKDKMILVYNIVNTYRKVDPRLLSNLDNLPFDFTNKAKDAVKQTFQNRIDGGYNIFSVETLQTVQQNLRTFIQEYKQTNNINDGLIKSFISLIDVF